MIRLLAGLMIVCSAVAVNAADEDLIEKGSMEKFKPAKLWHFVEEVEAVEGKKEFKTKGEKGAILINGVKQNRASYLTTKKEYKDVRIQLEFMVPRGSNAGVYFMGRYEIQILDSFGKKNVKHSDLGGLYQRWRGKKPNGYEGVAPKVNAAKAPGQWQTFDITFRAPRFDAAGKKTENARFIKVLVNGQLVHEKQEAKGPTRASIFGDEKPLGPLVVQGDHGPLAIRKFIVTELKLD